MPSYNLSGYKWGSPHIGTPGGTVTYSFAPVGAGQFFTYDAAISDAGFQQAVNNAFAAFSGVADISFQLVADSDASNIRLGWDAIDGAFGTIGESVTSYSQTGQRFGQTISSEIRFDSGDTWTLSPLTDVWDMDFYAVALHEVAHALGLDHVNNPNSLMHPRLSVNGLTLDAISGVQALYGMAAGIAAGTGTPFMDVLVGSRKSDTILALGGDDLVKGKGGRDVIYGGDGQDDVYGGGGKDQLFGGNGGDYLYGGGGKDIVSGETGNDWLFGGRGKDDLSGGSGDDTMLGGKGKDVLDGGSGNDVLTGDAGKDTFVFRTGNQSDEITDFGNGRDLLDLTDFGFTGPSDVLARADQSGADVLIDFGGGDLLTIDSFLLADLGAADFIL
ncbi:MAG: matrixin family metalloprotease [Paracoccaceae bacterium]